MPSRLPLRTTPRASDLHQLDTAALRATFLVEDLFTHGGINWLFTDLDRMAIAGVRPSAGEVMLENHPETGSDFFLQRRELGIINTGDAGVVTVDGRMHELNKLDCLYIGAGARSVDFRSNTAADPAAFFLVSCPAHATHPTTHTGPASTRPLELGTPATANVRKLYQYIHPAGIKSAQLVMGFTELAPGSVWNTMPPHTHSRRSEIYFYFDLNDAMVLHLLGTPTNTRHLIVRDRQAVLSPPWSIHCGCGTSAYRFIWAMAGENQTFDDMDKVALTELR